MTDDFYYVILSNYNPANDKQYDGVSLYYKQLFGSVLFLFSTNSTAFISAFITHTNKKGHIEDIQNLFVIPKKLFNDNTLAEYQSSYTEDDGTTIYYKFYIPQNTVFENFKEITYNITKQHSFNDYSPKNNKCFCYPYNYLLVTNNIGNNNIFEYENFSNDSIDFKIQMALSIGCSIRCVPTNYKKMNEAYDESIPLAKFPTFSWSSDAYTNWLTLNSVNIATSLVGTSISGIASVASKNIMGITSSLLSIGNLIGEFRQAKLAPNIQRWRK